MKNLSKLAYCALIFLACAGAAASRENSISNSDLLMGDIVKNDPDLNLETLPNGFTIAVYKSIEPPKRVSMRLLVRRGSLTESDSQQGIAHFVEHMAFNGTKNFPKGEMVEYFQRLGMAFGADTNAHTSFSETVYKIDMPENSAALIDDGLKLLCDYASTIEFEQSEIDRERGVILAEKKSRDTAPYRASVGLIRELCANSKIAERLPIGKDDVISSASRPEFLNFYRANYRPENMALVVVGDVDTAKILAEAKKYFSDLKADSQVAPSQPPTEVFNVSVEGGKGVFASEYFDADMRDSSAGIYLVSAPKFKSDTPERRVRDFRMYAISKLINLRFDSAKSDSSTKFSSAYADFGEFEKYAEIFTISARANAKRVKDALGEALKMYLGIMKNGFGEWELEKAKSEIINSIESDIKAKSTRQSAAISDALTSALSAGEAFTSPEQDLDFAKLAFKDFSAEDATRLFREFAERSAVFVRLVDSEKPCADFSAERAFAEVCRAFENGDGLSKPLGASSLKFADFSGQAELSKDFSDELGIRQVVFKNNVRANLKRTDFAKDEVVVSVAFGGGKYDLPEGREAIGQIAIGALLGGTQMQSYDEINVAKSDKQMNLNFAMDGDNFALTCLTNTENLQDSLKMLATIMRAPGFRGEALNYIKKLIETKYRQVETVPEAAAVKIDGWLASGNPILDLPAKSEVEKFSMADLRQWLEPIMKNSYMEVSVVGDFDEEAVLKWLGDYFGTMPERAASRPDYSAKRKIELTKESEKVIYVDNKNDARSLAIAIWPTCDRTQIKKMRAANILGAILSDELRKSVREKQGKVYSPYAYNNSSRDFNYGAISAICDTSPEYNAEVLDYIEKSAKKVADGISEDEFLRAKEPILKQVEKVRRMNAYWANSVLPLYQADSVRREVARSFVDGYSEITLGDVKNASDEFLNGAKFYRVKILPKPAE